MNIPLDEALKKMPRYAKFIKHLFTKKRVVSFDLTNNIQYCSEERVYGYISHTVDQPII